MYIEFVTPAMDVGVRDQVKKMVVENSILVRLRIYRTGGTPPCTKNFLEYLQLKLTCCAIQRSFEHI